MAWNQDFGEGARPGTEREQQSWRDSFNGGRAAGDWTGNHNARLDAERTALGTTWSGSSTRPSALELARSFVGPGVASVSSGAGATGTGAGNPVVVQGPRKASGGSLTLAGDPLKVKTNPNATGLLLGGGWFQPNPWFSDGADAEDRWGELGGSLMGLGVLAADAVYQGYRFGDWMRASAPGWNGATHSRFNEPEPVYQDGWVSYDERQTWEKAPVGSPRGHWSF